MATYVARTSPAFDDTVFSVRARTRSSWKPSESEVGPICNINNINKINNINGLSNGHDGSQPVSVAEAVSAMPAPDHRAWRDALRDTDARVKKTLNVNALIGARDILSKSRVHRSSRANVQDSRDGRLPAGGGKETTALLKDSKESSNSKGASHEVNVTSLKKGRNNYTKNISSENVDPADLAIHGETPKGYMTIINNDPDNHYIETGPYTAEELSVSSLGSVLIDRETVLYTHLPADIEPPSTSPVSVQLPHRPNSNTHFRETSPNSNTHFWGTSPNSNTHFRGTSTRTRSRRQSKSAKMSSPSHSDGRSVKKTSSSTDISLVQRKIRAADPAKTFKKQIAIQLESLRPKTEDNITHMSNAISRYESGSGNVYRAETAPGANNTVSLYKPPFPYEDQNTGQSSSNSPVQNGCRKDQNYPRVESNGDVIYQSMRLLYQSSTNTGAEGVPSSGELVHSRMFPSNYDGYGHILTSGRKAEKIEWMPMSICSL